MTDGTTIAPASANGGGGVTTTTHDLLEVEQLAIEFHTNHGLVRVVDDISFSIRSGETFGLVGESGSGKSVTSLAIMGLIGPPSGQIPNGSVRLDGLDLRGLSPNEWTHVRGNEIAMIFQEPRRSLDPAFTVGNQIAETVRSHQGVSRKEAWNRAVEMLDLVHIPDAAKRAHAYPHQFSGGMAQRVMLAIALACSPRVLIADEPTTALDVTVQAQVLELIRELQERLGLAVLFISHDLGVVAEMCDRVAVMYAGQIVEQATVNDLFFRPEHPYTSALLQSIPRVTADGGHMAAIPGVVPPAHAWPGGCRYHPRCAHATDRCSVEVPLGGTPGSPRCLRADEVTLDGVE